MNPAEKDPRYFVALIPTDILFGFYREMPTSKSPESIVYKMIYDMLHVDKTVNGQYSVSYHMRKLGILCEETSDFSTEAIDKVKVKWFDKGINSRDYIQPVLVSVMKCFPSFETHRAD